MHRGEDPPLPRVIQLFARAASSKIEALLIPVENFDEALRDLIHQVDGIDTTTLDAFSIERRRWSAAPRLAGRRGWPVVRLNALPVRDAPTVCRRVVCDIGGPAEVRETIERAGVDVIAARCQAGVLAFGSDADIRTAFEKHGITDFDIHTLEIKRQRYESSERGLLREALTRAFMRQRNLDAIRRRSTDLLAPANHKDVSWLPLKNLVGRLTGNIQGHQELIWREGIGIRLDWADDRLWILIEPRTVFDGINDDNKTAAADFARERTVNRYNRKLNQLITFWAQYLAQDQGELRALGIGDGIDAVYRLSCITSFSKRVGA